MYVFSVRNPFSMCDQKAGSDYWVEKVVENASSGLSISKPFRKSKLMPNQPRRPTWDPAQCTVE